MRIHKNDGVWSIVRLQGDWWRPKDFRVLIPGDIISTRNLDSHLSLLGEPPYFLFTGPSPVSDLEKAWLGSPTVACFSCHDCGLLGWERSRSCLGDFVTHWKGNQLQCYSRQTEFCLEEEGAGQHLAWEESLDSISNPTRINQIRNRKGTAISQPWQTQGDTSEMLLSPEQGRVEAGGLLPFPLLLGQPQSYFCLLPTFLVTLGSVPSGSGPEGHRHVGTDSHHRKKTTCKQVTCTETWKLWVFKDQKGCLLLSTVPVDTTSLLHWLEAAKLIDSGK